MDCRRANKGQDMTEFGSELILTGNVKYIGEGEDPSENPYMKAYARALKEIYQPDRLRRVDTENGEAIVGSANIDEIVENGRNDHSPQ